MKMLTSVSAETINNLSPDAGVVMLDVSIDDVDTVEQLMTLIDTTRSDPAKWVGVTDGGIKVDEGRKTWSPNHDYKRMPTVDGTFFAGCEPKVSFTLVEMTPQNVKAASGAADISSVGNKTLVQPRANMKREDYHEKMLIVAMVGADGLYIVEADNVLCTKGLSSASGDQKVNQLSVEFMAHKGDYTDMETLPMRYYFIPETAAAAASETGNTEQPAAYDPETAAE